MADEVLVGRITLREKASKSGAAAESGSKGASSKSLDSFASRIEKSMDKFLSKTGFANFKPTADKKAASSDAVKTGVAAGLVAGGIIGLLALIADAVSGLPMVTAIMKMLKLIIMALFFPLIPILKPVLIALGEMAKFMTKNLLPETKAEKTGAGIGAGIGGIVGAFVGGPLGALIGAALGAILGLLVVKFGEWIGKIWPVISDFLGRAGAWILTALGNAFGFLIGIPAWLLEMLGKGFGFLVDVGVWIWEQIIKPAFMNLLEVGKWIWEQILKPAWNFLGNVGTWIWEQIIKPAFNVIASIGLWIWEQIIKPAFNAIAQIGNWIWEQILKPAFDVLADVGNRIWDIIKLGLNFIKDIGSKMWEWIKTSWTWAISIGEKIWAYIKSQWTWSLDIGKKLWDWIKENLSLSKIFGSDKKSSSGGGMTRAQSEAADKAYNSKQSGTIIKVNDFMLSPGGMLQTNPNDFIIGTKNPKGLGGGNMTVNINIDKPTVSNQNDIKTLVKAIEMELYKSQKRYNSYA